MAAMEPDEYRRMAEVEDQMWFYRALHAHVRRELRRAELPRGARVLDAGCGTGGLIRRLATEEQGRWQWTGVDVSALACGLARERAGVEICEASVTALPWADGAFDAVVSTDVIYHLDDDAAGLREMLRVLRPGGALVVNVPAYRWLWSYHDVATHARRRYGRGELAAKLAAAGFGRVAMTHWNLLALPLIVARRKFLPAPREGSDVVRYPALVERVLGGAMALERAWLERVGTLAAGSSLLAVARCE